MEVIAYILVESETKVPQLMIKLVAGRGIRQYAKEPKLLCFELQEENEFENPPLEL